MVEATMKFNGGGGGRLEKPKLEGFPHLCDQDGPEGFLGDGGYFYPKLAFPLQYLSRDLWK
jgi:hypothetical protein